MRIGAYELGTPNPIAFSGTYIPLVDWLMTITATTSRQIQLGLNGVY